MDSNIIDTSTDQDFESHVEGLSADQAKEAAKNYINQSEANGAYNLVSHMDHRRAVDRVQKLYDQSHSEDAEGVQYDKDGEELVGRLSPEMIDLEKAAFAEQAEKKSARIATAQAEMNVLVELGYRRDEVPDDIADWEIDGLKIQRLNMESKFDELRPLLEKLMNDAKLSGELVGIFQQICQVDLDDEFKQEIIEKMLRKSVDLINEKTSKKMYAGAKND